MVERFNRRVNEILEPLHFDDRQTLADALHGYLNHYNRKQVQPALGGLTPLDYWNQGKDKGKKRNGKSPHKGEPECPARTCAEPEDIPPDPTILKRVSRPVQEHAITACHPQLGINNHPYSYSIPCFSVKTP